MKIKMLLVIGIVLLAVAGVLMAMNFQAPPDRSSAGGSPQAHHSPSHSNSTQPSAMRVPAFYETAPASLPPTLAPERFTGKTQAAYRAVREIPKTIAQLPCYCFCDEAHGHKSLHSCYEDEHAGSCAVCVDEVLLAYRLEKEKHLSPSQIRKVIIDTYSAHN